MTDMPMDNTIDLFLEESRLMLDEFENALLAMAETSHDLETLNSAFRAAHNIKGTAGMFGFERVVEFTHAVETLLDRMRDGRQVIDATTVELLLACLDQIHLLLQELSDHSLLELNEQRGRELLQQLQGLNKTSASAPKVAAVPVVAAPVAVAASEAVVEDDEDDLERLFEASQMAATKAPAPPPPPPPPAPAPAPVAASPAAQPGAARERKSEESRYIRVPAEKLDELISQIGEIVIAVSSAQLVADKHQIAELSEVAHRLDQLVEGARDQSLKLRMVPVGDTFARFKRIVHDVSRSLGKEVELQITGAETELDKSMVEQLMDPLTHLVRNALDHGVEAREQRLASGKSATGRIRLNAYHDAGSIVIEVIDDGRGLSRDRILAKAVERGLVAPDARLSDEQVWNLIFLPGFSTAEQVTDLSGRGVGMDVVRRNIEALRGEVNLFSRTGAGSTVQIRLPLTLAIIDGFLVEVAGADFVLPLDGVEECIETPELAGQHQKAANYFELRDTVIPVLCLRRHFKLEGPTSRRSSVVVVRHGSQRVGLVVDHLHGEHQTVIKPLGQLFSRLRSISGSTILGSGSVALILDIPALLADAQGQHAPTVIST